MLFLFLQFFRFFLLLVGVSEAVKPRLPFQIPTDDGENNAGSLLSRTTCIFVESSCFNPVI